MTTDNDEMDMIQLIRNSLSFINKNKWALIVVFVLGSVLGYFQNIEKVNKSKDVYKTQFIINSPFISDSEIYMIGRNLTYQIKENELNGICKVECTKEVVSDLGDTEVNVFFSTIYEKDINELIQLFTKKIEENPTYQLNYETDYQHHRELKGVIDKQLKKVERNKDTESMEKMISLIERKQALEKKVNVINNPIQFFLISPSNKLQPAGKINVFNIFGYGTILTIFTALIILLRRFIKLAMA